MSFDDIWKRFVSFGLMFSLGLAGAAFLQKTNLTNTDRQAVKPVIKIVYSNPGEGFSGCCDTGNSYPNLQKNTLKISPLVKDLKIISKPRAFYTDEARINQVQGKVVLRVTFWANGQIGAISIISDLPDGLTEQAIAAARNIRFEPAKRGGVPYSVTKPVEYSFKIY